MSNQSGLPGLFLNSTATHIVSGAAQMDGAASVNAVGARVIAGVSQMDGYAQVAASSIAATQGAAEMDGYASLAAAGVMIITGAAHMDGVASMIAPRPQGAVNAQMDGVASMAAVGASIGPAVHSMSLSDGVIGNQVSPAPRLTYHFSMFQNILNTSAMSISIRSILSYYVITDSVRMRPALSPSWHAIFNLVQNVGISQTTIGNFTWGRILTDTIRASSTVSVIGVYKKVLAQLVKLSDVDGLIRTIAVALSQSIDLSLSLVSRISLKLLQQFLVASSSSPIFNYHLTLIGQTIVAGIIGHYHFAAMALTQLFTVQPALSRQFIADSSMAELLTVHPALNNKLVLEIIGNLQLSPSQLVHMIYAGDPLLDGVVITALYVSPSGTTTTWAVNTRTNAVTEYINYDFRSFTRMGDRYIAAGGGGLYELDGDTDDGTAIISELMSGYLQLNDKKLFGIKGAYVAIRGGGRFYLKLLSGDGREYVYELKAQPNLMTTKVRIGKGISTTYIAFDLVTEGQDFDLDSLEFIPMTRGRRV